MESTAAATAAAAATNVAEPGTVDTARAAGTPLKGDAPAQPSYPVGATRIEVPIPDTYRYRAHPWHGLPVGDQAPNVVTAYIEIVPSDTVKFELDKVSGFLKVDRPQKYSNVTPSMYGFIPQTYCGKRIAQHAGVERGDGDPLDVCVLSDRAISHGDFIVRVVPIGGLCLIDKGEADDKIIAYVAQDEFFHGWRTLSDAPQSIIERLQHYFLTYKMPPGWKTASELRFTYERDEALKVINLAMEDYKEHMAETAPKAKL
uniref:inorganic diphosphatase n=1 Tax=Mastigamoeba balamuthi TaxID=108607 RepID=A0A0B4R398_MASBA|nr:inorganic pyrophosphatase IPP-2 [Mastigamoeba balamuthi]|eukprot:m51a1_g2641 putative inorganic pyrophosphatase (259) ;mRNA; r:594280-595306